MDAQPSPVSRAPLDGFKIFKELKSQKILQVLKSLRVGLEEQGLNTSQHPYPLWRQKLSSFPPRARHPNTLLNPLRPSPHFKESRRSDPPKTKQFPSTPTHIIIAFESHNRPPQYTWCGLLDRNIYPIDSHTTPSEKLELETIRTVPYYNVHDCKRSQSPAATLHELKKNANEARWKVCLDGRICPDVLRQNFYLLLAAFSLDSVESLCEIMNRPRETTIGTFDTWFLVVFSYAISSKNDSDYESNFIEYTQAWTNLKDSGRLQRPKISLDLSESDFTITGIIRDFRLTLPANKRLIFKHTAFSCFHPSSHQAVLCGICKQFYCEGHYKRQIQNPVISTMGTLKNPAFQSQCGPNCSRIHTEDWVKHELKKNESLRFRNWDVQSKKLLRTIKQSTGPERDSACDLVFFFQDPSRQCWQIWAAWRTISTNHQSDESEVNSEKQKTTHEFDQFPNPQPDEWRNLQPSETNGYVPCSHSGSCDQNKLCHCYKLQTFCDRFCQCPPDCARRYQGCSCTKKCDKNCECIKKLRECDPLVCKCSTCESAKLTHVEAGAFMHDCGNYSIPSKKKRTFVAPSKVAGFGLFAGETISCGDYLGDYTGILLRSEEINLKAVLTTLSSSSYLFDLNKVDTVDGTTFGNRTRFINEPAVKERHNASARIWYVAGTEVIRFFARRRIEVGQEIFIDYGSGYHHLRDWSN